MDVLNATKDRSSSLDSLDFQKTSLFPLKNLKILQDGCFQSLICLIGSLHLTDTPILMLYQIQLDKRYHKRLTKLRYTEDKEVAFDNSVRINDKCRKDRKGFFALKRAVTLKLDQTKVNFNASVTLLFYIICIMHAF